MSKTLIPHTAGSAAKAFKEKTSFVTVSLEADKNSQEELQALAFRMMAIEMETAQGEEEWDIAEFRLACILEIGEDELKKFTEREIHSAESLAFCSLKHGYAKTIAKFPESQRHLVEF